MGFPTTFHIQCHMLYLLDVYFDKTTKEKLSIKSELLFGLVLESQTSSLIFRLQFLH